MASGSLSGPSTMRATSRMITSSPPVTLNTTRSLRRGQGREMAEMASVPKSPPRRYLAGMQQRLPSLLDPPIAFAHRGAKAHAPENTIEAFALALRLGATGLESDVWLTSDGVPVLDHDGVVRARLRSRPIAGLARDQLPAHIPALTDLFAACGSDYDLSLDVKDPAAGPATVATVREAAPDLLGRLWLCYPNWGAAAAMRPVDPDIRLVDSTRLGRIKEGPERRAAVLADVGVDA